MCLVNFVVWYNCVKDEYVNWSENGLLVIGFDDFLLEISFDDNIDDDFININVNEC